MSRRSALIWSALGLAAAAVDAQSLQAALWLSRCTSGDAAAALSAALRLDQHALAFPWTMAVMVIGCGRPAEHLWVASRARLQSVLVMLLLMPLVCLVSGLLVEGMPPSTRPLGYALTMLSIGAAPGLLVSVWRRWIETRQPGLLIQPPSRTCLGSVATRPAYDRLPWRGNVLQRARPLRP